MSFNKVTQTKIRAALAWVRDKHGPEDVQHLVGMARQMRSQGAPELEAWNYALKRLEEADPALSEKIAKSFDLLDASDDATVARYEAALTQYLDNGDQSGLLEMRPDIARDDAALSLRNGELDQQAYDARIAEIEAGNIVPAEQADPARDSSEAKGPGQQFRFNDNAASPKIEPPAPAPDCSSQRSVGGTSIPATGMVAPKAAQLWARDAAAREAVASASAAQPEGAQSL